MSVMSRQAWNALYDLMTEHELTAETYLVKLEVLNNLRKQFPNESELEIGVLLLVIADSNMRDLVDANG
jgi:hypothetical protein